MRGPPAMPVSEQGVVHHPVRPEEVGADVEHRDHEVVALSGPSRWMSAALMACATVRAVAL